MSEIKSSSIRGVIMDLLRNSLDGYAFWRKIEGELAVLCADLPEVTTEETKKELVVGLKTIRDFVVGHGVVPTDIAFIDEEIERYEKTKQMSLYVEEEDLVEQSVIDKYARLGVGTEGIVGIHMNYNYAQLKRLTNGVYEKTGLIKFYISQEKTLYGKIVAEIYEHPQKIPIAMLIESRKVNKETQDPVYKGVALFGERVNKRDYDIIKQINVPFYVYRFITEHNQELIMLTTSPYEIGDYIITGVITECDDNRALTDSAKLPTKLPFLFAQFVKSRIIKYKSHEELNTRLEALKINKDNFFDYPFTIRKDKTQFLLKYPNWFKKLIWAWLLHQPKGLFNNYPLHILMVGPKHSGKSLLLNILHARSKEFRSIFSGSSSTMKNLVPSFKFSPAKLGYLAESNRFAFCDEFLRCIIRSRTTSDGSEREEGVAIMNDLLEHQKREAGSGISRVNVNMTSRILSATNPIRGIHNASDLVNNFDESFLSRWLIYYQTNEHIRLVRDSHDTHLPEFNFLISDNDWVGIIDYLQTFSAKYHMGKIEKIFLSVIPALNETLRKHYDARHRHHIECLMDGIVKTRCLLEHDITFKANETDYEVLQEVWKNIIKSWIDVSDIKRLDVKERIFYMPEDSQYIYWKIVEKKRPLDRFECEELIKDEMERGRYIDMMVILIENGILIETEGFIKPHYMDD